jgi:hypothetical protein
VRKMQTVAAAIWKLEPGGSVDVGTLHPNVVRNICCVIEGITGTRRFRCQPVYRPVGATTTVTRMKDPKPTQEATPC